jgi:ComF family protein
LEFAAAEAALCPICQRAHPRFAFAVSFAGYDGALRKLLHLLKYEQLRPAAKLIGARLAQAIQLAASSGKLAMESPEFESREARRRNPVVVIPVPLHRAKRRQRGFNQSELLARSALRHLDRSRFELHVGNLHRVRSTVSQTGLTRHQRRENVRGAFVVTAPERIRDRSVLIVDDVYTTGTTLNECARVLRAAGARHVVVATVARVYRETVVTLAAGETQYASPPLRVPDQESQAAKAIAG